MSLILDYKNWAIPSPSPVFLIFRKPALSEFFGVFDKNEDVEPTQAN